MNEYYEKIKFVKSKVISYLDDIFKTYGNKLLLKLGDYNLLQNDNNCLKSSTAIGYLIEEFIVSKLESYTDFFDNVNDIRIYRIINRGTQNSSYDCYADYKGVFFMINVKSERRDNSAVAAINNLHKEYVSENPEQEKSFIVLKTKYNFEASKTTDDRKILIKENTAYALEEVDFSGGHKQDHRNWGKEYNPASGRLKISESFRKHNSLGEEDISYDRTRQFLDKIYHSK